MKRLGLLAVFGVVLSGAAYSQTFTMSDMNSVVLGDAAGVLLYHWDVDGISHLSNENYFFRIGDNPEAMVSTLGAPTLTQFAANLVQVAYQSNQVRFEILYSLYGGPAGSGTSDISEIVRVTNLTNESLNFHLFEYDDFDLNGTAGGDSAFVLNSSTIQQFEGNTAATVGTVPPWSHYEIDSFPNILNKLNDNVATTLGDTTTGNQPGDMTFAMQYDVNIASRGAFLLSKDKQITTIVPEPATMAVLGLGLAAFLRKRSRSR